MVLVSFEKQFIYTKTQKTAGTSVEVFFQHYCLPPDYGDNLGAIDERITDYGIVGFRGVRRPADTIWYSHMPAANIRRYLGDEIWQGFFKFCTVRNPFDQVVSQYFFSLSEGKRAYLLTRDFAEIKCGFLDAVTNSTVKADRANYVIDGKICMDFFIRYERLTEDVGEVCRRLGIRHNVAELPRLKFQYRTSDVHFSEFYDSKTEAIVAQSYAFELDYFGYRLCE